MKKLILTFIAALTFATASADVIVQDVNNVTIAGANVGKVADACANHPAKLGEIQTALETYLADAIAAKAAAEASLAETQAFAASLVERAKAAQAKGDIAALSKVIADAATPAVERKRAALEAEKTKSEAEAARLAAEIAALPK